VWDAAKVGHILQHNVTPVEVEEVVGRPHVNLIVVFAIRRMLFRAVTAYEMNATDRRNYAPEID
jgi:hypothetical protein